MTTLVDVHLDAVAVRMGRLLRGFADPTVHIGTQESFARACVPLFDLPVIDAGSTGLISYRTALVTCRAATIETKAEPHSPIAILAAGLGGPMTSGAEPRTTLAADALSRDLGLLVREPVFDFYLYLTECESFLREIDQAAVRLGVALAWAGPEETPVCPCGGTLGAADPLPVRRCDRCGRSFETFVPMPMVPAVRTVASFDMLHEAVGLPLVESYQEASAVKAIGAGEGGP